MVPAPKEDELLLATAPFNMMILLIMPPLAMASTDIRMRLTVPVPVVYPLHTTCRPRDELLNVNTAYLSSDPTSWPRLGLP